MLVLPTPKGAPGPPVYVNTSTASIFTTCFSSYILTSLLLFVEPPGSLGLGFTLLKYKD